MAITVDSTNQTIGQPSAPFRILELQFDGDTSYPSGGYDVSGSIPGNVPFDGPLCPVQDGTTKRFAQITSGKKLKLLNDDSSLSEVADTTDVSNYTNQIVWVWVQ